MRGEGILRMDGEEILIKAGNVISKPAGKNIAHQFINNSTELLQILDVETREEGDFATYPDEDIILLRDQKLSYNISDNLNYWSSDHNE
ncbi:cupin domain-containing protein [Clostridium algoriphilum]|uniref:cupin domain-containing protein n=1 Tax=Clostridium algoriphilum TaxID=198347 RepID=UPI001CF21B95|nr:cupin domain-containing protein [Clostridium algoriphilum]MCB2292168.1 cupin domain-containing protein [Clostridium algoriphilum]